MTGAKRRSSASKASKGTPAYASVLVDKVLNTLIEEQMTIVSKNPRTVEKWLSKMKTSVLKKVSMNSRVIFVDRVDFPAEVASKQREIDALKAQVLEKARTLLKEKLTIQEPRTEPVVAHGFNDKVKSMGKKVDHMAHQLDSLNKDLQARVQSFGSTLAVVESSMKEKGRNNSYASRTSSRHATSSTSEAASAAGMLGDHLSQY